MDKLKGHTAGKEQLKGSRKQEKRERRTKTSPISLMFYLRWSDSGTIANGT